MSDPYAPYGLGWIRGTTVAAKGSTGATHSKSRKATIIRITVCKGLYEVGVECNRRSERCDEPYTELWTYCPSRLQRKNYPKRRLIVQTPLGKRRFGTVDLPMLLKL